MKKLLLVVIMMAVSFVYINADVYIKQETKSPEFMGTPAKSQITETWMSKTKMVTITDSQSVIVNLEDKKMTMINHKNKWYIVSALPFNFINILPPEMAGMVEGMMKSMKMEVAPNNQTKKIGTWDAKGYDVSMNIMGMEMKMTFWVSDNVGFDYKSYSELSYEMLKTTQYGEKMVEEFKKINGYPVAMEMSIMGMTVNTQTLEISPEKTPDPSIFTIPAGYTLKEKLSAEDLQNMNK